MSNKAVSVYAEALKRKQEEEKRPSPRPKPAVALPRPQKEQKPEHETEHRDVDRYISTDVRISLRTSVQRNYLIYQK